MVVTWWYMHTSDDASALHLHSSKEGENVVILAGRRHLERGSL